MIAAPKRDLRFGPAAIATRFCLMASPKKESFLRQKTKIGNPPRAEIAFALALVLGGKQNTDS